MASTRGNEEEEGERGRDMTQKNRSTERRLKPRESKTLPAIYLSRAICLSIYGGCSRELRVSRWVCVEFAIPPSPSSLTPSSSEEDGSMKHQKLLPGLKKNTYLHLSLCLCRSLCLSLRSASPTTLASGVFCTYTARKGSGKPSPTLLLTSRPSRRGRVSSGSEVSICLQVEQENPRSSESPQIWRTSNSTFTWTVPFNCLVRTKRQIPFLQMTVP